ncbi:glycoside hydrolase family 3 N-terminal domain-containing protein [[Limnothrix rosea] IAM M-220]|uniref:glycoside hydrolase family 3 N-terminal domain-containing protein n=1 Tax=[Limnothrix rosea] IAM M-220 TaxID=454133 RepID=UPI000967D3BE|nr:glycoside hydrolase family 3 N-terminal domain-containing protein [[Limnothrix rosea] IAM M-220]OKH19606.1 beta-glucosidase [[Limnothrix rosea] IAM M-220]
MGALPAIDSLSLRQLIGQLIVVRSSGCLLDGDRLYPQWEADQNTLQTWVKDWSVGGVILLGGSAAEVSLKTKQLQDWADIPLLIAADIEEGVGQRFAGTSWFPPPMALAEIYRKDRRRAIALAEQMGEITAKESLSIGINWILAPVMDVNNNPENPVINIRAFGETPEEVAALGTAFIRGVKKYPVLTSAKHFPGHGDTAMDSHVALPIIPHELERLEKIELPPFQEAIAAGVDSVMTAHLMIPTLDKKYPATLSPEILTNLLQQKLAFDGLIVTDALMMGGVTKFAEPAEVAVLALEAGADILLMPPDVRGAIAAIEKAIQSGRLTLDRLKQSVTRIWAAKQKLTSQSISSYPEAIAEQQTQKIITEILEYSSRHNNISQPLPTHTASPAQNLIIVDSILKSDFLKPNCPAIAIPQSHGFMPKIIELSHWQDYNLAATLTIVQIFTRGNPFTGKLAQPLKLLRKINKKVDIQAILSYGTPYFFPDIVQTFAGHIPCLFAYAQMAIAQDYLCSQLWNPDQANLSADTEFI